MMTGYQRPLQATDLWKMDPSREAEHLSVLLLEKLEQRKQKADRWNQSLATRAPSKWQRLRWSIKAIRKGKFGPSFDEYGSSGTYLQRQELLEREWRQCSGKREASLTWALNEVFPSFWWGGQSSAKQFCRPLADISRIVQGCGRLISNDDPSCHQSFDQICSRE